MTNASTRLLTQNDTESFKTLRLVSLLKDSSSWLATYEEEKDLPTVSFSNKIIYATTPPIFGYYGYFQDSKLLAYAQLASGYWNKKRHIVTLYDVCVSKKARRKSVGSRLIKFIIGKTKTADFIEQIHLRVNSRNTGAVQFYEKLGFEKKAVIKDAVKEKDGSYQDEYLYILKLR